MSEGMSGNAALGILHTVESVTDPEKLHARLSEVEARIAEIHAAVTGIATFVEQLQQLGQVAASSSGIQGAMMRQLGVDKLGL